jgi:hypothetical protein
MMGEDLWVHLDGLGEPLLKDDRNAAVELMTLALEQAPISGILHQRVLEGVAGVRRQSAAKHQLGSDQLSSAPRNLSSGIGAIAANSS